MAFSKGKWVVHGMYRDKQPLDVRKMGRLNQENPEHPDEYRNRHTLFRLPFEYTDGKVILRYAADDIARIYVNGTFVDMGPAASYHFAFGYLEIEITEHCSPGKNIIGAHLYYQGELNRVSPGGDFRTGFIAEVICNEEIIAFTDKETKCRLTAAYGRGDIIAYRTQYLEHFDANVWEYGWNRTDFNDDKWEPAEEKGNNDHIFRLQESKRLQFYEVEPVSSKILEDSSVLYDLGCEYTGNPMFEAKGKKGDVIEILCAEELSEDGHARYDMRCNCFYRQTFTLSGKGWEWPEYFDYMAFRYMELRIPSGVSVRNVRMIARNYPFDYESTNFNSENERYNGIWDICKNGVRTGTQEGYLDCPTREKGLYLGDMTITGQSHFYLTGDLSIMKRALRGFGESTYYVNSIQTTTLNHYINSLIDYSFQFPLNLLFYYKHSGDKDFLREMLPNCETMMDYYIQYDKDGLIYDDTDDLHLVDWPRNPYDFSDGYDYDLERGKTTGTHNVANVFYICGLKSMDKIYDILGMERKYDTQRTVDAYLEAFYDKEQKLFTDTIESSHTALHSNILPLYFGVAPDESIPDIIKMIEEKRLNCGVYISYFLLKALCMNNRHDLAFELITSDDRFSWGTMLKQDATTCFEVWDKEYKWNTSLCHPWASAPITLLIEDFLGIRPEKPGWAGFEFEKSYLEKLGEFSCVFHVNSYRIKAEADKKGNISIKKHE